MSTPALRIRSLAVTYADTPVLRGIDLDVAPGETVALLGPSGSGKTTMLYAVAGFVDGSAGTIDVAGRRVAGDGAAVPPQDRDVGFVFQHYALWPHLTALETVAYPLRRAGVAGRQARRRAFELLDAMALGELAGRRPSELSGGQQQRVGLARALARNAQLYLFDEPTAHLDTALRTQLQAEVRQRQVALGAAAVYATHDAGEALAVADRVVLLREGTVVQQGTPTQVYEMPADLWAAQLTGPASVLAGHVHATAEGTRLLVADGSVPVDATPGAVTALVRPDWARLGGPLRGRLERLWYRGPHTDYAIATSSGTVIARAPGPPVLRVGDATGWELTRVHLLDGTPPPNQS